MLKSMNGTYNDPRDAGPMRETGVIEQEIDRLTTHSSELECVLKRLEERIGVVLRSPTPEPPSGVAPPEGCETDCRLVLNLRTVNRLLHETIVNMNVMIGRVQL